MSDDEIKRTIDAWTAFIGRFMNVGWDVYMVTVLFHQLSGSKNAKLAQMNREMERLYSRLATRTVKKTRSPRWAAYLPKGIFVPDLPVPKSKKNEKCKIADVSINDGLHMGGIIIANRWARISTSLRSHFQKEEETYRRGKIRYIDVRPITHDLASAVDYTFKSVTRRKFTPDDVLLLNWGGAAGL